MVSTTADCKTTFIPIMVYMCSSKLCMIGSPTNDPLGMRSEDSSYLHLHPLQPHQKFLNRQGFQATNTTALTNHLPSSHFQLSRDLRCIESAIEEAEMLHYGARRPLTSLPLAHEATERNMPSALARKPMQVGRDAKWTFHTKPAPHMQCRTVLEI